MRRRSTTHWRQRKAHQLPSELSQSAFHDRFAELRAANFADSLLEESGFEPSVLPGERNRIAALSSPVCTRRQMNASSMPLL